MSRQPMKTSITLKGVVVASIPKMIIIGICIYTLNVISPEKWDYSTDEGGVISAFYKVRLCLNMIVLVVLVDSMISNLFRKRPDRAS